VQVVTAALELGGQAAVEHDGAVFGKQLGDRVAGGHATRVAARYRRRMPEVRPVRDEEVAATSELVGRAFADEAMITWTVPPGVEPGWASEAFFRGVPPSLLRRGVDVGRRGATPSTAWRCGSRPIRMTGTAGSCTRSTPRSPRSWRAQGPLRRVLGVDRRASARRAALVPRAHRGRARAPGRRARAGPDRPRPRTRGRRRGGGLARDVEAGERRAARAVRVRRAV
jgi:hypothetical protein